MAYMCKGDYDAAILTSGRGAVKENRNSNWWFRPGLLEAHEARGEYNASTDEFKRAAERDPGNPWPSPLAEGGMVLCGIYVACVRTEPLQRGTDVVEADKRRNLYLVDLMRSSGQGTSRMLPTRRSQCQLNTMCPSSN
jgi:hypothetical protein